MTTVHSRLERANSAHLPLMVRELKAFSIRLCLNLERWWSSLGKPIDFQLCASADDLTIIIYLSPIAVHVTATIGDRQLLKLVIDDSRLVIPDWRSVIGGC